MAREPRRNPASAIIEVVIVLAFLVLVGWFVFGPVEMGVPAARTPSIEPAAISIEPMREVLTDRPVTRIGPFEMGCMECHRLFESRPETARRLTQHQHIVLDHGLNDRCFNCHDNEQRDRLALRGSRTIAYTEVARLCAKCHGPTYRDWQRGMHGRSMGAWDPASRRQRRLRCSACHDPHAPAFEPMRPMPGPHTLRMGPPKPKDAHGPVEMADPLRKWQHEEEQAHRPVPPEELDPPHVVEDGAPIAERGPDS